jgi:hypothetical protein
MTRRGAALMAASIVAVALASGAGASGHKPKPNDKPIKFTAVYSGSAEYSSHRHYGCLDESEQDKGKWTVAYHLNVPRRGDADFVGDEGTTFPDEVSGGYGVTGSGCGAAVNCTGDLDAQRIPEDEYVPILAGKPNAKGSAIDFTVDAPSYWRASNVTGGDACPEDGERAFYPAYKTDPHALMLQAEFKLPIKDLRGLPAGGTMRIQVASRAEQLPPNDCTIAGVSCTQELSPWKGKVVIRREE